MPLAIIALASSVAGGISGWMDTGEGGAVIAAVVAVTTSLAMAISLWVCARWWRGLDEAAQEAHKWAWWWGSTFGLAVGGVILLTVVIGAGSALRGRPDDLMMGGAGIVAGSQVLGYAIAWSTWWLKRR